MGARRVEDEEERRRRKGKKMERGLLIILYLLVNAVAIIIIEAAPQGSLVTHLPGFTNNNFPSKHHSGYINIDEIESGKKLFYYFVTSERSPAEDPVVLWLNGGPGCSSFDGFVYEHGPFNFEEGNPKGTLPTLHLNPYSWSKVSNIIYLDSPAGVGLSYSTNHTNYITGDLQTASDTHTFLLKESLMQASMSLHLLPKLSKEAEASCGGNYFDPQTDDCFDKLDQIDQALERLNIYDILEPCYHSPNTKMNTNLPPSFQQLGQTEKTTLAVRKRMFGRAWPFRAPVRDGIVPLWPQLAQSHASTHESTVPCMNDEVATIWLNDESVRAAIHAEPRSVTGPWELCTQRISYDHDAGSMIPYHINLTSQGYRALIFSGDHDMCVPYTGSQAWTSSVGYKIVDEWRPWFTNSQVAGYLQGYQHNLTFLTIKGAGHTVPEYKPREALDFYSRWLHGNSI
ncbi:serine carboxypeptidase-like 20 isoform X5 [Cucumis melo]|uniref:Serine carboxypeptidase-like 20 isoform X5 n=1 Tax=Cucumis melo TaxID=3656 RepID=A0ABM3KIM0_CUCME|nr:serine carboxypeptidase-like 20 isoform X5 [Cucumis melo]